MIHGRITPDLEVLVPIELFRLDSTKHELHIGVDTGFTGYLILPVDVLLDLGAPRVGSRTAKLGDGGRVSMDAYLVEVLWRDQQRRVLALHSEGRSMIGLSLLYGHRLTVDVVQDGRVAIECLP